jgi:hypothetical protein
MVNETVYLSVEAILYPPLAKTILIAVSIGKMILEVEAAATAIATARGSTPDAIDVEIAIGAIIINVPILDPLIFLTVCFLRTDMPFDQLHFPSLGHD